jgi:predicted AAA+ superfamily ATPase
MKRLIEEYIFDPEMTAGKMLFLTGPRQIGKTTFAKGWLSSQGREDMYFNWDDPMVMREYARNPMYFANAIGKHFDGEPVPVVFDEIHKQKGWRNILKAVYDTNKEKIRLLVTGSARLSWYRKSGDSLVGRYFLYRLLPLGLPEATGKFDGVIMTDEPLRRPDSFIGCARKANAGDDGGALEKLLSFGGFPEPFVRNSRRFYNRWQRDYRTLLTKEDIRDLSRVSDLRGIAQLAEMLPDRVGAPLSINSVAGDLGYHHRTITGWIELLKELYLVFTVRPYHKSIARSIRKEAKIYFLDWSVIANPGYRFENLIAVSLWKMAFRLSETGFGDFEVMFIRDKEKREVDFVLTEGGVPLALFEAKSSDTSISSSGKYFARRLGVPFYQVAADAPAVEVFPDNCAILPAPSLLMMTG